MARTERWRKIWMALATVSMVVVIYFVMRTPPRLPQGPRDLSTNAEVAQVVGPRLISVTAGSALEKKLQTRPVETRKLTLPVLTVTGSVAAHFANGAGKPEDRWQFESAEVSTAYADWRRGQNDVAFSGRQLDKTRELATAQVARFREVYERLEKLVATGTETKKDLASAKADLVQAELQTKKDVFEAESALNIALRSRAAAERTLLQAGVDPSELEGHQEIAIVVAEVPEARMGAVRAGEGCEARFYGIPDRTFTGKVTQVAPTLSPDRRTLRVLFDLADPEQRLRPGMFADVGLGTDARDALLVPTDAVIHVGRSDFVFAREKPGPWHVQEVELGEPRGETIEVERGVAAGQEIIGGGAILLKPLLVRTLEG